MNNIILIGMPGAGKSTVGIVLAKILGFSFLDSDLVIQEKEKKRLYELIDEHGIEGFHEIEEKINSELEVERTVIATGGSAVYGKHAMENFKEQGVIIYLKLPFYHLKKRLGDLKKRGVTLGEGQSLYDLYQERIPLYEKWADIVVPCQNKNIGNLAEDIARRYEEFLRKEREEK